MNLAANDTPDFGQHIDVAGFDTAYGLMFEIHKMVDARRQFTVAWQDGAWVLSAPKTGPRVTVTPQPTPPTSIAMAA